MAERELLVRIVGDDRDLQRALRNTDRSTAQINTRMATFGKTVTRAFGAAGIALGTSAAFAQIERSVSAASDLNEQISRIQVVLGDSAQEVIRWSKTTADGFGISQRAALAAASNFAGLFKTMGVGDQESGRLSKSLVELAADLASLGNTSTAEALQALRSGLAGEAEPLRRFNIFLSETRVQQAALTETGKSTTSALTAQEKTLARYNLILRDSAPAIGNFKDTQGELANQSRKLQAQMDELSVNLGQVFLPAVLGSVKGLNSLIDSMEAGVIESRNLRDAIRGTEFFDGFNEGVSGAAAGMGDFFLGIRDGIPFLNDLRDAAVGAATAVAQIPPDTVGPNAEGRASPGKVSESNRAVDRRKAEKAAKDLEKSRKAFAASIKGLGLKLEKAGLTSSLTDDLAVIREIEGRIQRQIEVEGHTFELEQQLVRARSQEQAVLEQIARESEEKQTKSVKKVEDKAKDEREKRKRIRQQAVQERQKDLLEALGLTREGEKPTPSSGALLRRARSIQDQVKGTALDTPKTHQQLARIVSVLKKNFKTAGKDVRQAILEMLNDISGAGSDAKSGPLTKTTSLRSKKILAGLGLSPEEIRALRGRLSNFNSAGVGFAGANNSRTTGSFSAPIVVQSTVNVTLDGQKVAAAVTKQQQKSKKRNPQQKRGPNRR